MIVQYDLETVRVCGRRVRACDPLPGGGGYGWEAARIAISRRHISLGSLTQRLSQRLTFQTGPDQIDGFGDVT